MSKDLNHAIHRVRTVERALRTVDDFDFVNVVEREVGEINEAARNIRRHAVHQHFGVIRVAAVEEQRCLPSLRAGAPEAEARLCGQQIGQ